MMTKVIAQQRLLVMDGIKDGGFVEMKIESRNRHQKIVFAQNDYELILQLVRGKTNYEAVRAWSDFPHPVGSTILPQGGYLLLSCHGPKDLKITLLPPHNCIQYRQNGLLHYGMVQQLYKYHHPNEQPQIAITISSIHNSFAKDPTNPSKVFQFICYLMKLVIGQKLPELTIISTNQISNLMAY
ncbi:hypothetical protein O181_048752 [Austropuccinia psidii MF-1]|uniref:Uncharacterized protein n=1 Tax=Austropuccinia psidii MF-1 TaxID=1389203 RepID=A0A9Q3HLX9_9BASI|nr:hypothetical protein [Austropuccinia psidii MF-1]